MLKTSIIDCVFMLISLKLLLRNCWQNNLQKNEEAPTFNISRTTYFDNLTGLLTKAVLVYEPKTN